MHFSNRSNPDPYFLIARSYIESEAMKENSVTGKTDAHDIVGDYIKEIQKRNVFPRLV